MTIPVSGSSYRRGTAPVRAGGRVLAASARNAAILRTAHDVLATTLAVTTRETAIHRVELAFRAEPQRTLLPRLRSRWAWRIGTLFAALDVVSVVVAWLVAPDQLAVAQLFGPAALCLVISNRTDLHRSRLELSVLDDLPAYVLASVMTALAVSGIGAFREPHQTAAQTSLVFGAVCFVMLTLSRACTYHLVRMFRRTRLMSHPIVIIGAGDVGQRLAGAMLAHPEYGLRPVGFIDSSPAFGQPSRPVLPMLGGLEALPEVLRQFDAHDVVFAFGSQPDAHMVRIVRACVRVDLQVFVVPRYFELCGADRRARIEMLWGVPLVRLRRWPLRPSRAWIKRGVDVTLACLALVALAPVLAVCALLVRLDGGPGVIFRQVRVGRNGAPFTLFKFRSMRPVGDEGDRRWSIDNDARITALGRCLRRTSLDELPQLVNVLRGDMSLVGPRPERPFFVQGFASSIRRYGDRHRVATGLTGWAQVNGLRGDTSIEDRVTFDNYYIDNWSLWNDVKIMLRTVAAVSGRTGSRPMATGDPQPELVYAGAAPPNTR